MVSPEASLLRVEKVVLRKTMRELVKSSAFNRFGEKGNKSTRAVVLDDRGVKGGFLEYRGGQG